MIYLFPEKLSLKNNLFSVHYGDPLAGVTLVDFSVDSLRKSMQKPCHMQ